MTTSTPQLSLGLDSSTQSLTAVVVDIGQGRVVHELSLDYGRDERLAGLGLHARDYLVPPRVPGEADQPPELYLASLDALFADLQKRGVRLDQVAVINVSGQQHGHLYLSAAAGEKFARLRDPASAGSSLPALLAGSLAYQTAPIWRTSNTAAQAEQIRAGVGGKARMIELSGSDSPLRFTGAVMRRVGQQFPEAYAATEIVQLISSYIPAVLCGDPKVPTDFGNGSGMSLMDYQARAWSDALVAAYFVKKYGFSPACRVAAGSGDNPQTKVLVAGDLLSLGTSFVFMVSTDGKSVDREGYANAMYDGVGRPFAFGCRTNGAMVWDRVRAMHGLAKKDYGPAEKALAAGTPGAALFLWQPENESFPASPGFAERRVGYDQPSLQADYGGIIDSTLAAVYVYSRHFSRESAEPLHVTGGATDSPQIMRRVAAIWNRPVAAIGKVGAALGTAVAGASALQRAQGQKPAIESLAAALLPSAAPVAPSPEDVARYHGKGGYLERFRDAYPRAWAK